MSTLPKDLLEHLVIVYPEMAAASVNPSFLEVLKAFEGGTWGHVYGAHWLLEIDPRTPHRASVSVAVEPSFRGRGLGTRMLEQAEAKARELGCAWLTGWLWKQNAAALRMDVAFGFRIAGELPDAYRGPQGVRDMVLVVKEL